MTDVAYVQRPRWAVVSLLIAIGGGTLAHALLVELVQLCMYTRLGVKA